MSFPEDKELPGLAYMECRAENKSIEEFIAETVAEQKGSQQQLPAQTIICKIEAGNNTGFVLPFQ